MSNQVVAISINKVQSFLFDTILSHTQEKQTEMDTLKNIMKASNEISKDFAMKIEAEFDGTITDKLLSCSGVYIFQSTLEDNCITEKLNRLFVMYYEESQGKKQLRYVHFPRENLKEIEAIKKAKQLLLKPENFAAIVERNKEKLFSFDKVVVENKRSKDVNNYPKFARDINALYDEVGTENSNHFRMAVIKADLDGMGDMFKNIEDYRDYKGISDILNDFVSLEGLHKVAASEVKNINGWIFPFYVAGDDIFFAVSITNVINGINVCRKLIKDINEKIELMPKQQKLSPKQYKLSLSVGVEIVFNREPIRYYLDMVEKQLKKAKSTKPSENLEEIVQSKISIAGVTWLDFEKDGIKKYKKKLRNDKNYKKNYKKVEERIKAINREKGTVPIWSFFLDEVAILNYIKNKDNKNNKINDKIGTSHFYYSLLEKLTDEKTDKNKIQYINNVLYHLIPKYLDAPIKEELWKLELMINRGIIKQLYQKCPEEGDSIQLNKDTNTRMEAYLRLMILFSDKKYKINGIKVLNYFDFNGNKQENVLKELFTKPMDYMYELLKKEHGSKLLEFFAMYEEVPEKKYLYFKHLSIDKSMFYKLRRTDKIDVSKAANMIQLQNHYSREEIEEKNKNNNKLEEKKNNNKSQEKKKPRYMYFDKEKFIETAENSNQWNEDFIDSLMLLYEYNSLLRRYGIRCFELKGRPKK